MFIFLAAVFGPINLFCFGTLEALGKGESFFLIYGPLVITHSGLPGYITYITYTFCRIEFVYWSDSIPSFSCQVDSRILKKKNSGSNIIYIIYNAYYISKKKCERKCLLTFITINIPIQKFCTIFIDYRSLWLAQQCCIQHRFITYSSQ